METVQHQDKTHRSALRLLESPALRPESLLAGKHLSIRALEHAIELLKRERPDTGNADHPDTNAKQLQPFVDAIGSAGTPSEVVDALAVSVRNILPAAESGVYALEGGTGRLINISQQSTSFDAMVVYLVEAGVVDWVIAGQRAVILPVPGAIDGTRIRSMMIVPIIVRNRVQSIFLLASPKIHDEVTNEKMQLVCVAALLAAMAVDLAISHDRLESLTEERDALRNALGKTQEGLPRET